MDMNMNIVWGNHPEKSWHHLKFGGRRVFCINHTLKGSKLKIRCVPPWHCWAFRDFDMFMTVSGQNRVKGVKIQFVVN